MFGAKSSTMMLSRTTTMTRTGGCAVSNRAAPLLLRCLSTTTPSAVADAVASLKGVHFMSIDQLSYVNTLRLHVSYSTVMNHSFFLLNISPHAYINAVLDFIFLPSSEKRSWTVYWIFRITTSSYTVTRVNRLRHFLAP
jgi:hypothetical protein